MIVVDQLVINNRFYKGILIAGPEMMAKWAKLEVEKFVQSKE
ncbi:hypothetical protein [Siminovitchia fordii]|uniref:Uncharacterized protein n=1 Tax=Siminovitchia fordii TaxID=254759 RepID=A0ABQ4K0P6_9BACI|nr:hypothetical protein [Siminovitchia fordii]GIN19319.1 hypothetical protein J1TS3_04530 [Siminovitchia fordii]